MKCRGPAPKCCFVTSKQPQPATRFCKWGCEHPWHFYISAAHLRKSCKLPFGCSEQRPQEKQCCRSGCICSTAQEEPQHPQVLSDATHPKHGGKPTECCPPQEHTLIPASPRAQQIAHEKSIWGTIKLLIKGVRREKIASQCVETERLSSCPARTLPTGIPSTTSMARTHQIASCRYLLPILVSF